MLRCASGPVGSVAGRLLAGLAAALALGRRDEGDVAAGELVAGEGEDRDLLLRRLLDLGLKLVDRRRRDANRLRLVADGDGDRRRNREPAEKPPFSSESRRSIG